MIKLFFSEQGQGVPEGVNQKDFVSVNLISDCDFIIGNGVSKTTEAEATVQGKYCPPYSANKKSEIYKTYKALGEDAIETIEVTNSIDIEQFPHETLFLKPNVFGGGFTSSVFEYLYAPITKAQAITYLPNHNVGEGLVAQPCLLESNNESKLIIVSGVVNGSGGIYFEPSIKSTHRLNFGIVHTIRGILSADVENEVRRLTGLYLKHNNIKNCLFGFQFLNFDDKLLPMDFQYRMPYFNNWVIPKIHPEHTNNLYKFAFDAISEVPDPNLPLMSFEQIDIPLTKDAIFVKQLMAEMNVKVFNGKERRRLFCFTGSDYEQIKRDISLFKGRLCS